MLLSKPTRTMEDLITQTNNKGIVYNITDNTQQERFNENLFLLYNVGITAFL